MIGGAKLATHAVYSRAARLRLRKMITEFRPDVTNVRNIYHHLSPSILWELKAQGVPVVYHINDFKLVCPSYNMVSHGHACERCHNAKFWHVLTEGCYAGSPGSKLVLAAEAYFHSWLRTYKKCVDRFLAPSRFVKDKLIQNGWETAKIDVLPHFQQLPPRPAERSGSRCPGPLLWTAFAGERIDRPTASHATSAESPLVHRRRGTPKGCNSKKWRIRWGCRTWSSPVILRAAN